MPNVTIDHYWNARVLINPEIDMAHIPGLRVDGSYVTGPIDAVSTYLRRGNKADGLKAPGPFRKCKSPHLRDFQRKGVRFILSRWAHFGSALLTDEMGLGKTLQALTAIDHVKGTSRNLVICPRSVCLTWQKEISKWSDGSVFIAKTREEGAHGTNARWFIVSYELVQYLSLKLYKTVIIDEAHNFAGRTALRAKALKQICAMSENRLGLTGTEIWSRPRDYWMLFSCLFGSNFGSKHEFDLAYCKATPNEHGGLDNSGASRLNELRHRVSFYRLRRLKRDVASELPKSERHIRWIEPAPHATALMKAAFLHKNRGAYQKALAATLDAKMVPAMDAAADSGGRFLLFTWMKRHAHFMHRELTARGFPNFLIDGSVSPNKRNALIALAAKRKCGIVATLDTLKEGVDGLQHVASTGIMHALDFVPLKLLQGEKRLDRIEQLEPVTWIYILMKESMDVWVNETVLSKLQQWEALMGEDEGAGLKDGLGGKKTTSWKLERQIFRDIYKAATKRKADEDSSR